MYSHSSQVTEVSTAGFSPSYLIDPRGAAIIADGLSLGQQRVPRGIGSVGKKGRFWHFLTEATLVDPLWCQNLVSQTQYVPQVGRQPYPEADKFLVIEKEPVPKPRP